MEEFNRRVLAGVLASSARPRRGVDVLTSVAGGDRGGRACRGSIASKPLRVVHGAGYLPGMDEGLRRPPSARWR